MAELYNDDHCCAMGRLLFNRDSSKEDILDCLEDALEMHKRGGITTVSAIVTAGERVQERILREAGFTDGFQFKRRKCYGGGRVPLKMLVLDLTAYKK